MIPCLYDGFKSMGISPWSGNDDEGMCRPEDMTTTFLPQELGGRKYFIQSDTHGYAAIGL